MDSSKRHRIARAPSVGGLSVRTAMTLALGALGCVAVVACASLILLTALLHRSTLTLNGAVEALRIADALEDDLQSHSEATDRAQLAALQEDLQALVRQAHAHEVHAVEDPVVAQLDRAVADYLADHHAALASGLAPTQAAKQAADEASAAFTASRHYRDSQIAGARAAQARARTWNKLADALGVTSALAIVLLGGGGLFWIRRYAFSSVSQIADSMHRFRAGSPDSRAPLQGPAELREIAWHFNEMATALSQQQENQLTFLAGVVHDLRNPLTALQLSAGRFEPERTPLTIEQARATLGIVRRQLELLNRMTGDLLDATQIQAGRLQLRLAERDLRVLAHEAVELFQAATPSHHLSLQMPDRPVPVRCDPLRIEQVLNNLISNAIKYSPAGGQILVALGCTGEEAQLRVVDQGVGIAPDDLPHIFEPFRRTGASRETVRGVGLGLFVTRRLVVAHGGRVEVESRPGLGSVFKVSLPLLEQPGDQPGPRPTLEPQGASPH